MKKKALLFLFGLLITMAFSTAKAQEDDVIFRDDFTDNRNRWEQTNNTNVTLLVRDGGYIIEHKRKTGAWVTTIPIAIDQSQSFVISATFSKLDGPNENSYGLVWGLNDQNSHYVFLVNGDGSFSIGKKRNDNYSTIVPPTISPAINKWNAKNTLAVKKISKELHFFINGNLVVKTEYEPFEGSRVGFIVQKDLRTKVENLVLYSKPEDEVSVSEIKLKKPVEHIVKQGENLLSIARQYNVTVDQIIKNNPNLKWKVYAGLDLLIPPNVYDQIVKSGIEFTVLEEPNEQDLSQPTNVASTGNAAYPPDLFIENLQFIEPSNNRALDASESGSIEFDLVNNGRGEAKSITVKLTPVSVQSGLRFEPTTEIMRVSAKAKEHISIPISASDNVDGATCLFRLEVSESNGFDADPAVITFETNAAKKPDLQIKQVAIDDKEDTPGAGDSYGNGNSVIEAGESIEVTAFIQNFGAGKAKAVKATVVLNTDDKNITYPDAGKVYELGDIESGGYRKINFYFYTSRRYATNNLPIAIKLAEGDNEDESKIDLGLKLGQRTPNVVDLQVAKINVDNNNPTALKQIDGVIELSDVDKDIPVTTMSGENTLAIIIGIENYKYAPLVDYASRDAQTFYQYAKNVFGIPERNIYYRMNDGATSGEFTKIFIEDGWLARRIKEGVTDIIIYYAGHGAPDTKSNDAYLIPYDIDPNYASTGFSLNDMYASLSQMKARNVTVFLDACFSGVSRSEQMLLAGTRTVKIKPNDPILTAENITVFSAANGEQYGNAYPEKGHGLFTYYLLKGIKTGAILKNTTTGERVVTSGSLYDYVAKNVKETAAYLDKEQTPTFISKSKNRILIKY